MGRWQPDDETLLSDPSLLRALLARDRRMLDADGFAFWEWGVKDNSYRVGGGFWKKLGYSELDEMVISVDDIQEFIHPDDYIYVKNTFASHVHTDAPIDMVYRIRAKDGNYCWTQVYGNASRDKNGYVTYLSGINVDLSHLKETEKALRLSEARHERVLAASNDGIWEWSATDTNENPKRAGRKGKFHTSYSFWKHLGYSEEEVDALPESERLSVWISHIHPHDINRMRSVLKQHFITREPIDLEYRMFGEKGKMFWMRTRGNSIFNHHNRMILMSGINIDITQVKESEERVNKARTDAEKANRSKSNFLSSMSHELRTPLNAILGFSRLLVSDPTLDKAQNTNAGYIHEAGDHLLRLINDVLDLAQIEAGKLSLTEEMILPAQLVQESFNYCLSLAKEKNITLRFDGGEHVKKYIHVDRVRLRQCLLNLISNAVKYNVIEGKVDVVFKDINGDLEIAVNDTGAGIPKDKQASLFEMFNRLGAERSSVEGSGLGLVLTKQLVTAMGGVLSYCSETAPGASFKMLFPVAGISEEQEEPTKQLEGSQSKALELAFSDSKTVFYIEDNQSNIRLMESLFQSSHPLTLRSEMDPFKGLFAIRQDLPDMIILDINLPGMSGYDLLQVLKKDPLTCHIPTIALSASAMAKDIEKGLEKGFDAYLTKPLNIDALSTTLNRLLIEKVADVS